MNRNSAAFDRKRLLRSFDGDVEELRKIVKLFLEDSPVQLSAMRDALLRCDPDALENVAHRLKGSAGYFAADKAFTAAAQLEAIARSGALSGAAQACENLEQEILRLSRAFAALESGSGGTRRVAPLRARRRPRAS